MKKVTLFLLTVLLVLGLTACAKQENSELQTTTAMEEAAEPTVMRSGRWKYILLKDGTAEIVGYTGSVSNMTIPAKLDGYTVTSIGGDKAFDYCDATRITIPDSVTNIGDEAFYGCGDLISITIPDSVTSIGVNPFIDCADLEDIHVSSSHPTLEVIDGVLFEKTEKRLVCYPCKLSADSYVIPQGTRVIGDKAFYNGNELISITIPDSVMSIGTNPFAECPRLSEIRVSADHPTLETIDGVLFDKTEKRLVCYPRRFTAESYAIPQGARVIGDQAFYSHYYLKSVTIPDSVTSIGADAFSWCNALTSVNIPNSVTSINANPFMGSRKLSDINVSIDNPTFEIIDGVLFDKTEKRLVCYPCTLTADTYTIPQGIRVIGDAAFLGYDSSGNDYLENVIIPDSVTIIGNDAFHCCDSLKSIIIPNSVTSIGNNAFEFCISLENISIPNSVKKIGDYAFECCYALTSVTIPNSMTSIGKGMFSGCGSLQNITIPDSVTSIGDNAFSSCYSLNSITIPNSVTSIGDQAFGFCENLTSITIPNSVTSIGDQAFHYCKNLTSINLSDSLTSIGNETFSDCYSLKSIIIPDGVTSIGDQVFLNCKKLESVTIPSSVTSIGNSVFRFCGCDLVVEQNSYAEQYAIEKKHKYTYPD